jgi:hypothetical protein
LCAARQNKQPKLLAEVRRGLKRDAVLYSVGANATNGQRRTNEDKRRAVLTLLNDPEWGKWSNSEVARRCAVEHHMVGALRASLGDSPSCTGRQSASSCTPEVKSSTPTLTLLQGQGLP